MAQASSWDMPFTEEEKRQLRENPSMKTTFKIQLEFLRHLSKDVSAYQAEQFLTFLSGTYEVVLGTRKGKQTDIYRADFMGRRGFSNLAYRYIKQTMERAGKASMYDDFSLHQDVFLVLTIVRNWIQEFTLYSRDVALTTMKTGLPAELVEELRHTARLANETGNPKHFTRVYGVQFLRGNEYAASSLAINRIGILHNLAMVEENTPALFLLGFPEVMTEVLTSQSEEFRGYATMCISQAASMAPHLLDEPSVEGIMWMAQVVENGLLDNIQITESAGAGPVCRAFRGLALSERNRKIMVSRGIASTMVKFFRIADDQDKTWTAETLRNLAASPSARKSMRSEGAVASLQEAIAESRSHDVRRAATEALDALSVDNPADDPEGALEKELPCTIWDIRKTYGWLSQNGIKLADGSKLRGRDLSDLYQKRKKNPASFFSYCREDLQLTRTRQLRLFTEALEKLNEDSDG